jgi:hypothetical protein
VIEDVWAHEIRSARLAEKAAKKDLGRWVGEWARSPEGSAWVDEPLK